MTSECWLWTGEINPKGYAYFYTRARRHWRVHRWVYLNLIGEIPAGMQVCHKCDVRHCVNPDHMFVGTNRDNALDMVAKGRHAQQRKTACKHGHPFSPENTRIRISISGRRRECIACSRSKHISTKQPAPTQEAAERSTSERLAALIQIPKKEAV